MICVLLQLYPAMNKKIGLLFGSFNPFHIGHLIAANHLAEYTDLWEVWLVVTPYNPLKEKQTLLAAHHRLEMVRRATEAYPKLKPCNVEFSLPQPNYTVDTLTHLQEKYSHDFALIIGEDALKTFNRWKNYNVILNKYPLYVYPRMGAGELLPELQNHFHIQYVSAPMIGISSTQIREGIHSNKNVRPLLPPEVWQYIYEMNCYKGEYGDRNS